MWIATNRGFLSVVTADPKRLPKAERQLIHGDKPLCVRARKAAHLKTLFPDHNVYQWPGRDYPARIFIGAAELAELMAKEVLSIGYSNFKSSVKDDPLHDAYMGVWGVMNRYGQGFYDRRAKYNPLQSSFYDRFDGRPFNEQVPDDDDEPCSTPGCTEDFPCMNCITDALDKADQKYDAQMMDDGPPTEEDLWHQGVSDEDRYGDFDEDEDADATSHKRIAP